MNLDALVSQFGGPQQFQQALNSVQSQLYQCNMSPEQFIQNKLQSGELTQDRLNAAIQKANMFTGRR